MLAVELLKGTEAPKNLKTAAEDFERDLWVSTREILFFLGGDVFSRIKNILFHVYKPLHELVILVVKGLKS